MRTKLFLAALSLAAASAAPAFCDTISFAGNNVNYGPMHTFPSNITAYGYDSHGHATNLFGKNGGGSESGLGLYDNGQNEINQGEYITLNTTSLTSAFTLSIGSTQDQEGFIVYLSHNMSNPFMTTFQTVSTPTTDPFTTNSITNYMGGSTYVTIYDIGDPNHTGNVLLDSLTTSAATPEPSSLMLLGTGILAAAGVVRRKLAA